MATKTISIDLEAYARLKDAQRKHESFSQTIKRVIRKRIDLDSLLAETAKHPLSDDAVHAVEQVITDRRRGVKTQSPRER